MLCSFHARTCATSCGALRLHIGSRLVRWNMYMVLGSESQLRYLAHTLGVCNDVYSTSSTYLCQILFTVSADEVKVMRLISRSTLALRHSSCCWRRYCAQLGLAVLDKYSCLLPSCLCCFLRSVRSSHGGSRPSKGLV